MAGDEKQTGVVPSVQMPSADLIKYRFDQSDKNLDDYKKESRQQFQTLANKLDDLTTNFATKEELHQLESRLNNIISKLWMLFITILSGFAFVIAGHLIK